ncbi:MAG TPA: gliding motility-associated C-terminal domain-containing protein, partial [Bacteroidia bacterium]|nr:gliding motility-associated C-terminal domain-containing protein [Bacteroidia bacterium]
STICSGNSVSLTASGATNYKWSPVAGLSCTSCSNTIANPVITTTYTVVGSNGTCTDTDKVIITVNPTPTVIATPAATTLCSGESVKLSASGATGYTWSPGTGLSCTNCFNPTAIPLTSTTYTVVGTSGSCSDTQKVVITINPTPTITVAPVSPAICAGSSVSLTASGAANYTWSPNAGLSCSNCPNPIVNPTVTTTYTIVGSSGAGCNDTIKDVVTVNPNPVATVSANITIEQGSDTVITATGGGSYLWTPATGLSCNTCPNPIASPLQTTSYCVQVTNASGCTDTACMTITINDLPCGEIFVPTAFSPNGDKENDLECVLGGCIKTIDFAIFDRWGNKVFETQNQKQCWDGTYKGQPMNTGTFVYYLNAVMTNGSTISKKGNITLVR